MDPSQGQLLPTSGTFSQQGSLDWVGLSRTTVSFTVEALQRYMSAGVSPLTVVVGQAITKNLTLSASGRNNVQDALKLRSVFVHHSRRTQSPSYLGSRVRDIRRQVYGRANVSSDAGTQSTRVAYSFYTRMADGGEGLFWRVIRYEFPNTFRGPPEIVAYAFINECRLPQL
ncbi:hypothetical protein F5Y01DRAFT_319248 [Xylaria sp. FL0043]|nr:hypothetical protein F5Y01DRAFT_319248 [Xylaria sp. FL0043]